jgi:hypothetical protein
VAAARDEQPQSEPLEAPPAFAFSVVVIEFSIVPLATHTQ